MEEQRQRAKADAKAKKRGHADTEVCSELRALGRDRLPRPTRSSPARRPSSASSSTASRVERDRAGPAGRGRPRPHPVLRRVRRPGRRRGHHHGRRRRPRRSLDVQRPVKGLIAHTGRGASAGRCAPARRCSPRSTPSGGCRRCQAHSGTHVIHAALRQVLGPTALQAGSYNKPGYLRLDFAWGQALSPATRSEIEEVANHAVRKDLPVSAHLHAAAAGPRDRRAGAVRRDLRRGRAGRRDRRPVVARAVRWHPRRSTPRRSARSPSPASPRSAPACAGSRPSSASTRCATWRGSGRSSPS